MHKEMSDKNQSKQNCEVKEISPVVRKLFLIPFPSVFFLLLSKLLVRNLTDIDSRPPLCELSQCFLSR